MPSEHPITTTHAQQPPDQSQSQIKLCSTCHCPLSVDSATTPFLLHDGLDTSETSVVCGPCRIRLARTEPPSTRGGYFTEMQRELLRWEASLPGGRNEAAALRQSPASQTTPHAADGRCPDEDTEMGSPASASLLSVDPAELRTPSSVVPENTQPPAQTVSVRPPLIPIDTRSIHPQVPRSPQAIPPSLISPLASASGSKAWSKAPQIVAADPLVDITRLRVRSQGHHCLYPGATFQGTQKSGRNSYDVNVTIVNVDFSSSHLCGYLRIRGLTDDWPELTTYFDAEIIGSRYGFLTRNWGATEQEDMVHWARFPAFRHVRHDLKKPHLTMKDANRGAVFMRWKEKFLVPDHRVQDINGASFAGFYYVCVDFNPQQSAGNHGQPFASAEALQGHDQAVAKPEMESRARRASSSHGGRRIGRSVSRGHSSPPVATMSGFYFHQNSEPYQQLSLVHVQEPTTSSFEFR